MPQVSLYIDAKTMEKIESEAKKANVSISSWVRSKIKSSLSEDWPKKHIDLFGAIQDGSFKRPENLHYKNDATRLKI